MRTHLLIVAAVAACGGQAARTTTPAPAPAAAAAPQDPELAKLVALAKDGPSQAQYPQADAVVALDQDDITLLADGTVVEHKHTVVRLLEAQRGKEKFADVHIPFDTSRQTLTLGVTRTINADGAVHVASPEEIGDIVPPQLVEATQYSNVRERVVSFPAVDVGSVIDLDYTRTTKPTPDGALGGELPLATSDPILLRKVTITVPAGATPRVQLARSTLALVESTGAAGARTLTYTAENVPLELPEIDSPPDEALLPRLLYSFVPDWSAAKARLADRYRAAAPAEAVKAEAARLVAGATTESDRALALYRFVAHDIHAVSLPLGWAGYAPNPPETVLANRYGDERDKVGLLLALCAAQGIEGSAVLVRSMGVPVVEAVPTVAQFDRLVVRLTVGGKELWLDPTDEHGQFGIALPGQDNLSLALDAAPGQLARRAALDPARSVSSIKAAFTLNAKGDLEAQYQFGATGLFASAASQTLRRLKGENLARFFQVAAARLSASAVDRAHKVGDLMSVSGPLEITQKVSVPGYSPPQGRFQVFHLPPATLGFLVNVPSAGLSKRSDPLWLGTPRTFSWDMSLKLPAGWKVAYLPTELKGSAEGVEYSSHCAARAQTVECKSELRVAALRVDPEKYEGFRQAMARLDEYGQRVVLLTR